MKKSRFLFFASFAIAIAGIFILSFYFTSIITYVIRYNNYSQLQGTIVGYTIAKDGKKAMVINYEVDGTDYQVLSTFSKSEPKDVGYSILVRYDEEHPNMYILGDEKLPFDKLIIGFVMSIIGISGMAINYKNIKKPEKEEIKGE